MEFEYITFCRRKEDKPVFLVKKTDIIALLFPTIMHNKKNRRQALKNLALGGALLSTTGVNYSCQSPATNDESAVANTEETTDQPYELKGNIKHSVCRWCYSDIPLESFLEH